MADLLENESEHSFILMLLKKFKEFFEKPEIYLKRTIYPD
jgi:hypothetical protein